jgi:hypothetical protein
MALASPGSVFVDDMTERADDGAESPRDASVDERLEAMLDGCLAALTEALALADPVGMARAVRIRNLSDELGKACRVARPERFRKIAFLSQVGTLALPQEVSAKLHAGALLTERERQMVRRMPQFADRLLSSIPGLEDERTIIALQDVHARPTQSLPVEAAILRVAIGYDRLMARGTPSDRCLEILRSRGLMYDADVLAKLESLPVRREQPMLEQWLQVRYLAAGMEVVQDVVGFDGRLLLRAGNELSIGLIDKMRNLTEQRAIAGVVLVRDRRRRAA